MKKSLFFVLLLVLTVIISGCVDDKANNKQNNIQKTTSNNTQSTNNQKANFISPEQAQKIAQTYIEEPGAVAGTPKLIDINGMQVYIVPVLMNGTTVGEIHIDATTGQNVGGAGGVLP